MLLAARRVRAAGSCCSCNSYVAFANLHTLWRYDTAYSTAQAVILSHVAELSHIWKSMYAFERCSPLFLNDLLPRLAHRGHAMARAPRLAAATSLLLLLALLQNAAGQTTLQVLCLRCVVLECSIRGPVSGGSHLRHLIWQNHREWRPPYPQDSSCYAFNLGTKSGSNFGAVKGQVRLWIVLAWCLAVS